jgi:hypothetical protein
MAKCVGAWATPTSCLEHVVDCHFAFVGCGERGATPLWVKLTIAQPQIVIGDQIIMKTCLSTPHAISMVHPQAKQTHEHSQADDPWLLKVGSMCPNKDCSPPLVKIVEHKKAS